MARWIKLHDKLLNWEWHDEPTMLSMWIHLLLLAGNTPRQWRGMTLERGQLATTVIALSELLGLSVKQVRLAIEKLKKGKQIIVKGTNKFSIITICNYDTYQVSSTPQGQTKGKQTGNQRANAIIIEDIEDNNISHTLNASAQAHEHTHVGWAIIDDARNHGILLEQFCMTNRITREQFFEIATEIVTEWELTDTPHSSPGDAKRHLFSTVRIKAKDLNNGTTIRKTHDEQVNDLYTGAAAAIARLAAEDDAGS